MSSKESRALQVCFSLFVFVLLFAPLAFGAVEVWSLTLVESFICIVALLLFWSLSRGHLDFVAVPALLPLLLLLLWMLVQLIPLPMQLLGLLSPGSHEVYSPINQASGVDGWYPISVNPRSTIFECIRISSYALVYLVTVQLLANGRQLQKIVTIIIGFAIFLAFLAILQRFTSPDLIYWFRPVLKNVMPAGPWVNRSQYAGFMVMILPLLLGLFLYYQPRADEELSLRAKVAGMLSGPGGNNLIYLAFGIVIVLLSILLAMSRGGILYTFISILLFYYLLSRKRAFRFWPLLLIVILGVVFFLANFGVEEIAAKFNSAFTKEGDWNLNRIDIWRDTIELIQVFWLTGSGFGTYVDIFPVFKTITDNYIYDHAHNDYLELLSEGGVVGFILAGWFVLAVLKTGWTMIKKRRDQFSILIGIGAMVGVCSMLLYALTDFNMHNGADGLYFFVLCGLVVSASHTRFQYHGSATLLQKMPERAKIVFAVGTILLFSGVLIFPLRGYIARNMFRDIESVYFNRHLAEEYLQNLSEKVKKISLYDPLEGTYLYVLGNIERLLKNNETAQQYYLRAVKRQPLRGEFLQQVAMLLPQNKADLANELMELSYKRTLKKDELMLNFAGWLIWRGEKERAVTVLAEGLSENNTMVEDAALLLNGSFTPDEVQKILPPRVEVWVKYANFLHKTGQKEESGIFIVRALDFLDNEEEIKPGWFSQLYNYYRGQGKEEEAIAVIRLGISKVPEHGWFHIVLGDYYKKQGVLYRAREEYEQALVFDPEREGVIRKRLESLE